MQAHTTEDLFLFTHLTAEVSVFIHFLFIARRWPKGMHPQTFALRMLWLVLPSVCFVPIVSGSIFNLAIFLERHGLAGIGASGTERRRGTPK